jgi:hypothetical protein
MASFSRCTRGVIRLALTEYHADAHKKNPEIALRVLWFVPAEIASVLSETNPYLASFSINFSTMLAGTSS